MHFDESIRIPGPPADVFALLIDVQDWAVGPGSPVKAMEKQPIGPTAPGTRWREVVRLGPALSMTVWSEATEVIPGRQLTLRFWGGSMEGMIWYTLTPDGDGTVLRQREDMHAVKWLRPVDRILGRMLKRRLSSRLRDIRVVFEQRNPA